MCALPYEEEEEEWRPCLNRAAVIQHLEGPVLRKQDAPLSVHQLFNHHRGAGPGIRPLPSST